MGDSKTATSLNSLPFYFYLFATKPATPFTNTYLRFKLCLSWCTTQTHAKGALQITSKACVFHILLLPLSYVAKPTIMGVLLFQSFYKQLRSRYHNAIPPITDLTVELIYFTRSKSDKSLPKDAERKVNPKIADNIDAANASQSTSFIFPLFFITHK